MNKYSVVEFLGEGSADVVVSSWIFSKEGVTYTYWPPAAQVSRALRKCEAASTTWSHYECRQLCSTGR